MKGEEDQPTQNAQSEELNISLDLKLVKKHKGWFNFRHSWSQLALKNENSYFIGPLDKEKFTLFENGEILFSGKVDNSGWTFMTGLTYIESLDCYLFNNNRSIYRKDIDQKPPYLFLDQNYMIGQDYLDQHQSLVFWNLKDRILSVVNLETKKTEFESKISMGGQICGFRSFGGEGSKEYFVSLMQDGYLFLHELDFEKKEGAVVGFFNLELDRQKNESTSCFAVCEKNQYVLLEAGVFKDGPAELKHSEYSRMVLVKLEGTNFVKKASTVVRSQKIGVKFALKCCGYSGSHILWLALTSTLYNQNGVIQIFDYNTVTGELKELEQKRIPHQEKSPHHIHRFGDHYYYTGTNAKLMKLSLKY